MSIPIVLAVITSVGVTYFFVCFVFREWLGFRDIVWFFLRMLDLRNWFHLIIGLLKDGPHVFLVVCVFIVASIGIFIGFTFYAFIFWTLILNPILR